MHEWLAIMLSINPVFFIIVFCEIRGHSRSTFAKCCANSTPSPPLFAFHIGKMAIFIGDVRFRQTPLPPPQSERTFWMVPYWAIIRSLSVLTLVCWLFVLCLIHCSVLMPVWVIVGKSAWVGSFFDLFCKLIPLTKKWDEHLVKW